MLCLNIYLDLTFSGSGFCVHFSGSRSFLHHLDDISIRSSSGSHEQEDTRSVVYLVSKVDTLVPYVEENAETCKAIIKILEANLEVSGTQRVHTGNRDSGVWMYAMISEVQ